MVGAFQRNAFQNNAFQVTRFLMPSQTDFDQGGTFRTKTRIFMGPTVGWVEANAGILRVGNLGTTNVLLGNSIVSVSISPVVIQLPAFKGNLTGGAGVIPGTYIPAFMIIIDSAGVASIANPITINAASGELIDGLASTTITSPYGALILQPDPVNGGSTILS